MTTNRYTCDDFAAHLADHLERDADPATQSTMEAHAASCDACGALLADLAALRSQAAALPLLAPSRDLWGGIAARIETPVVEIGGRRPAVADETFGSRRSAVGGRRWWRHPALLAAGLVGVTAGVTYYATRQAYEGRVEVQEVATVVPTVIDREPAASDSMNPGEPGARIDVAEVAGVTAPEGGQDVQPSPRIGGEVSPTADRRPLNAATPAPDRRPPTAIAVAYRQGELGALDSLYHGEIVRLRTILGERRTQLDSTTVAVLERNMTVIDRAIAECRKALAADPASRFLNQQLNEALESKIELLRTAATMPIGS